MYISHLLPQYYHKKVEYLTVMSHVFGANFKSFRTILSFISERLVSILFVWYKLLTMKVLAEWADQHLFRLFMVFRFWFLNLPQRRQIFNTFNVCLKLHKLLWNPLILKKGKIKSTACLFDIHLYLTVYRNLWYIKSPQRENILFIFGLVCYFCPGSQNNNILTVQYKRISNRQVVSKS